MITKSCQKVASFIKIKKMFKKISLIFQDIYFLFLIDNFSYKIINGNFWQEMVKKIKKNGNKKVAKNM
tara:strand:- start:1006 stop:1209 length:204 start_codon:yes stop_codon:yes gene_type:complete